jgi:hypothetical protein
MINQDYFWTWIEAWIETQSMPIQVWMRLTEQGLNWLHFLSGLFIHTFKRLKYLLKTCMVLNLNKKPLL